jgi:cytochrome c oxidase subunit 1
LIFSLSFNFKKFVSELVFFKRNLINPFLILFNFFYSIYRGTIAPQNPWNSNTLEWTTPVEHVHGNWPGELPTVHRWPYDYSKPGSDVDFIPQTVALAEGEEEH